MLGPQALGGVRKTLRAVRRDVFSGGDDALPEVFIGAWRKGVLGTATIRTRS
jgi:hypothetical protein